MKRVDTSADAAVEGLLHDGMLIAAGGFDPDRAVVDHGRTARPSLR